MHRTEPFVSGKEIAMKNLWQEFKTFAFKGNMIDLAVGVIIGAAFGKVISSLVDHIFMPLIAILNPGKTGYEGLAFTIRGSEIKVGLFIGALINFLIVAVVVFLFVIKIIGALTKKAAPAPAPSEPTTKECPECLSTIPIKAKRCAHCTALLEAAPA
jgi:large conductance mechanosensitive channel